MSHFAIKKHLKPQSWLIPSLKIYHNLVPLKLSPLTAVTEWMSKFGLLSAKMAIDKIEIIQRTQPAASSQLNNELDSLNVSRHWTKGNGIKKRCETEGRE